MCVSRGPYPRNEGAKLSWRKNVHLEHCYRVWANRFLPYLVYSKFGEFSSYALPQSLRKLDLLGIGLEKVDCHRGWLVMLRQSIKFVYVRWNETPGLW